MDRLQYELQRIERKLNQLLTGQTLAAATVARIYAVAAEADAEITRMLRDPLLWQMYEYDGQFFKARGVNSLHRAFNGFHILQSLRDSTLDIYFQSGQFEAAIDWLMRDLSTHLWQARIRRTNWENWGTLSCVHHEVIAKVIQQITERSEAALLGGDEPPPLSPEETAFFRFYENQLIIPPRAPKTQARKRRPSGGGSLDPARAA